MKVKRFLAAIAALLVLAAPAFAATAVTSGDQAESVDDCGDHARNTGTMWSSGGIAAPTVAGLRHVGTRARRANTS